MLNRETDPPVGSEPEEHEVGRGPTLGLNAMVEYAQEMGLGKLTPTCAVQIAPGLGKGRPLPSSPMRRAIDPGQAQAALHAAASSYFTGYSVTPTRGVYRSEGEPSVAIRAVGVAPSTCPRMIAAARCLAADLRTVFRQHSVLLTAQGTGVKGPVAVELVTRGTKVACNRALSRKAREAALRAARRAG